MSPLLAGRRTTALPERLDALAGLVRIGEGRVDPEALERASAVVNRAGERLRLSTEHTVVALAGATGSGKSSLFNALAGLDLSPVGVRRPTTAEARACVWGEGAGPLLDWLGIPRRHQLSRESPLDPVEAQPELHGLVLLDLPDHDSTAAEHRLEVDRLVELVDLMVWVMDPQKYADRAVHERYLQPLAGHGAVTVVALNQIDTLSEEAAEQCLADLRRLLDRDGLSGVTVLPTSARTGHGVGQLQRVVAERVAARRAATDRLAADVDAAVEALAPSIGEARAAAVPRADRATLVEALCGAAGVPVVAQAVERSHRYRAAGAVGWPFTRWLRKLRPDPLRRLRLGGDVEAAGRSSLPEPTPVARSQVDTGLRRLADATSRGLPPIWTGAVRAAVRAREGDLPDALDQAVTGTDLEVRTPAWWRLAGFVQLLLAAAAVIGLLWLLVLGTLAWLQLPDPPTPSAGRAPWPTLLLVGGLLLGALLGVVFRSLAGVGARRRRRRALARLRARVEDVAERLVLEPVSRELAVYVEAQQLLERARPGGR